MSCPKCKRELEISAVDVNLDRNSLHVRITCSDNSCTYFTELELKIEDIIIASALTERG